MKSRLAICALLSLLFVLPVVAQEELLTKPEPVTSHKVKGLELPEDQSVTTLQRAVLIKAQCEGTVKWIVFNAVPAKPVSFLEAKTARTLILFPNDNADVVTVFAYAAINNEPVAARTVVRILQPNDPQVKQPDDTDAPPKTTVSQGSFVTIVVDYTKMTPELNSIVSSKPLRDKIKSWGMKLFVLSHKSRTLEEATGLKEIVTKLGGPPVLIIQNEKGLVLAREKVTDVESVLATILQFTGESK